jgi:hypothetical protein
MPVIWLCGQHQAGFYNVPENHNPIIFCKKIIRKPKEMIPQLMDFVKKYPTVPLFYNYLAVAYGRIGDRKKWQLFGSHGDGLTGSGIPALM